MENARQDFSTRKKSQKALVFKTLKIYVDISTHLANLEILEGLFPHYFSTTLQDDTSSVIETDTYSGSEEPLHNTINMEDNELSDTTCTQVRLSIKCSNIHYTM